MEVFKEYYGKTFNMRSLLDRLNILYARNEALKYLCASDLVEWNRETNVFQACDFVWIELHKLKPNTKWYYYEGDYAHEELNEIFEAPSKTPTPDQVKDTNSAFEVNAASAPPKVVVSQEYWVPPTHSVNSPKISSKNAAASSSLVEILEYEFCMSGSKSMKSIMKKLFRNDAEGSEVPKCSSYHNKGKYGDKK